MKILILRLLNKNFHFLSKTDFPRFKKKYTTWLAMIYLIQDLSEEHLLALGTDLRYKLIKEVNLNSILSSKNHLLLINMI